ncbi:uncharacterized mitochondrial protein AtMg00810-like [Aristolochia californica]|uniref:uncharacterized mitochondrial protein AtMg00810-like n=1 Tax=Aristolochia californica TaxID=171875 RepID=UPI0035DF636F
MAISMNKSIWNNRLSILILAFLIMFASFRKLYMASSKPLAHGFSGSALFLHILASSVVGLILRSSSFIGTLTSSICSYMLMILLLRETTPLFWIALPTSYILSSLQKTWVPSTTSLADGLFLSQLKYAHNILARAYLLDSKPVHTPMVVSQYLSSNGQSFSDPTLYHSLVGALQYLTITRPDIAHAVNSVSQFLHSPTADHFLAVKRILRYVKGTLHYGLTFHLSASPGSLVAYSDADWAGCPDTRHSTSDYSIYLGDYLVSWSAKKQPTVSRSSCESEYHALALTAAELLWLTHLLRDLQVSIPERPLLLCDNKNALFLSSNLVVHKRDKHVELDIHFLRELVVAGKIRTQYVLSHLQVVDIFTKSVSRPLFQFFRSKLHVYLNPTLSLRGVVEDTILRD